MGSLAKRLGQWSRKSLESESAHIFREVKANKVPGSLSLVLDGTLKQGHDMKVFGLGTLATMASRPRYQRFLTNLQSVYSTLEEELDATSIPAIKSSVIRTVWKPHERTLRRSERLRHDMTELQGLTPEDNDTTVVVSHATLAYLHAIRVAGEVDRETGSGRLLGHLYCRYFADLFGGQLLARPYQCALQLPRPPRHLEFDFLESDGGGGALHRRALVEHLYTDLNQAGELLTDAQMDDVRKESLVAFHHNVQVYSEEPDMLYNAGRGILNAGLGWATSFSNNSK